MGLWKLASLGEPNDGTGWRGMIVDLVDYFGPAEWDAGLVMGLAAEAEPAYQQYSIVVVQMTQRLLPWALKSAVQLVMVVESLMLDMRARSRYLIVVQLEQTYSVALAAIAVVRMGLVVDLQLIGYSATAQPRLEVVVALLVVVVAGAVGPVAAELVAGSSIEPCSAASIQDWHLPYLHRLFLRKPWAPCREVLLQRVTPVAYSARSCAAPNADFLV